MAIIIRSELRRLDSSKSRSGSWVETIWPNTRDSRILNKSSINSRTFYIDRRIPFLHKYDKKPRSNGSFKVDGLLNISMSSEMLEIKIPIPHFKAWVLNNLFFLKEGIDKLGLMLQQWKTTHFVRMRNPIRNSSKFYSNYVGNMPEMARSNASKHPTLPKACNESLYTIDVWSIV